MVTNTNLVFLPQGRFKCPSSCFMPEIELRNRKQSEIHYLRSVCVIIYTSKCKQEREREKIPLITECKWEVSESADYTLGACVKVTIFIPLNPIPFTSAFCFTDQKKWRHIEPTGFNTLQTPATSLKLEHEQAKVHMEALKISCFSSS